MTLPIERERSEKFFEFTDKSSITPGEGEYVIVFYTSKVDKMGLFASYVWEGLHDGDRVVYVYPDGEDNVVRARLRGYGVDVKKYEDKGSLLLMTLSQAYLIDGVFDRNKWLNFWAELKADAMKKGYKHQRNLIDIGDFSFFTGQEEKYFDYLKEANTQLRDPYLMESSAVNVENLGVHHLNKFRLYGVIKLYGVRLKDLFKHIDAFSRTLWLNHNLMSGRKILVEFDPALHYEKLIQDFVTEALANVEPIVVFTRRGSITHSSLREQKALKFFCLTQQISAPKELSENETLLPASDTSLMLDVFDKTLKAHPHETIHIVFDSLSDLLLSIGFEKTYHFTRYASDMLASPRITALFLLNRTAHDLKVTSTLRSLFSNQIAFGKSGIETVKFPEAKVGIVNMKKYSRMSEGKNNARSGEGF